MPDWVGLGTMVLGTLTLFAGMVMTFPAFVAAYAIFAYGNTKGWRIPAFANGVSEMIKLGMLRCLGTVGLEKKTTEILSE